MTTVVVDNKRLETKTIGKIDPARPVLIFLHPGLGCIEGWKDFPEKVVEKTGIPAFLYSRYGYGKSEPLKESRAIDYLHREGEAVLPALLESLKIKHPILVGHSDGATISLLFAAKYPSWPKALILEAPHVFVEDITVAGLKEAKEAFEQGGGLKRGLERYHLDAKATFYGWNDIWLKPEFRGWNVENELKTITCPILLIQGEDDQYGTIAQLTAIKAATPHTEILIIPECKHSPHDDQPAQVLASMEKYIMGAL